MERIVWDELSNIQIGKAGDQTQVCLILVTQWEEQEFDSCWNTESDMGLLGLAYSCWADWEGLQDFAHA